MRNQRNAIVWAIVSWLVRRWLRRRAATVAGIAGGAAGRGRVRSVLGALALVGVLAGAFVAWRKLAGGKPVEWGTPVDVAPELSGDAMPA
jgi:hypothetical protein